MDENCFQLQFSVYRNYNSPIDEISQASPWETKPENLRNFMDKIEPAGGWGTEAVEIGLQHCNLENKIQPISQVILIGDIGANSKKEVQ